MPSSERRERSRQLLERLGLTDSAGVPMRRFSKGMLQRAGLLDDPLRAIEADLVRRALDQSGGDRARACSLLGISARSLRYLLEKHRAGPPA
jgi:DNA-binding NtrC family response regulator